MVANGLKYVIRSRVIVLIGILYYRVFLDNSAVFIRVVEDSKNNLVAAV